MIYDGTLPTQETRLGSIDELLRLTRESTDRRPAILVVGRVAALREHLRWFDQRPLFGKRILVTRPREQAGELVEWLEADGRRSDRGADDSDSPARRPCAARRSLRARRHVRLDHFSSARAVDVFIERLLGTPLDLRALAGTRLCAVGQATADRLRRYGLKVDLMPAEYRAEAVVGAMSATVDIRGLKVLLPRANIGREVIADELRKQGADVTDVVVYRTVITDPEREEEPDVYRMLLDRRIDVVTFTSASAVRHFVKVLGAEPAADLLRTTIVASIGPVTAEAAAQCRIETTIQPPQYTIPALVDAIAEHFAKARHPGVVKTP